MAGVRFPRIVVLLGLMGSACGGSSGQAPTTTGITTVGLTAGSSTGTSGGSSTTSTSSSGYIAESSDTTDTSTGAAPDLPDFDTLGPAKGCGKIDILFVINDGGSALGSFDRKQGAEDALAIRGGANGFIAAMQDQAEDYDLHVMVVKGDRLWRGTNGPSDCCTEDKYCDELGTFPCDPDWNVITDCDSTLGAGVRYPAGYMASNQDCGLADGHRYITDAQDDFAAAFDCILNVGQTGGAERHLGAMMQAVGPTLNGPGGCNEGFVRPDAMLVVVMLADYSDDYSPGTPEGLAAGLIAAKSGYAEGIVVVGILGEVGHMGVNQCSDDPEDRARKFMEGFPNHVIGSFCAPDIGVYLSQAIGVIQAACEDFTPPG